MAEALEHVGPAEQTHKPRIGKRFAGPSAREHFGVECGDGHLLVGRFRPAHRALRSLAEQPLEPREALIGREARDTRPVRARSAARADRRQWHCSSVPRGRTLRRASRTSRQTTAPPRDVSRATSFGRKNSWQAATWKSSPDAPRQKVRGVFAIFKNDEPADASTVTTKLPPGVAKYRNQPEPPMQPAKHGAAKRNRKTGRPRPPPLRLLGNSTFRRSWRQSSRPPSRERSPPPALLFRFCGLGR